MTEIIDDIDVSEYKIFIKNYFAKIKDHTLNECKRCGKNITSYCELCWVNNILSLCNEVLKDE